MTEPFAPQFPTHVDATMVTLYKACHYKFWLQQIRGFSSPQLNINLHFGGVFAKACELARHDFFVEGKPLDECIQTGSQHILQNFGDWDTEEVSPKTLRNCIWAFENYFREAYPLGMDRFVPYQATREGRPMIEFSFAIPTEVKHPITDDPILYAGRCDMLAVDRMGLSHPSEATEIWAQDEKTTKQMGASWAKQWKLRGQFIGYTWAGRQHQYPVSGALVRGICVYKKNAPKYDQAFVNFSDSVINRWHDQLMDTMQEMVHDWKTNYWKQDFGEACQSYGGCSFLSMCELEDPEPFLKNKCVERRWDPLRQTEISGEEQ